MSEWCEEEQQLLNNINCMLGKIKSRRPPDDRAKLIYNEGDYGWSLGLGYRFESGYRSAIRIYYHSLFAYHNKDRLYGKWYGKLIYKWFGDKFPKCAPIMPIRWDKLKKHFRKKIGR
jgi:hypothetical protein